LKSDLYAGIDILRRARDPSAAKKKLAEARYGGEPIAVIAPTEQEMEFGAVVKRRTRSRRRTRAAGTFSSR
jgi:hypothetical protein